MMNFKFSSITILLLYVITAISSKSKNRMEIGGNDAQNSHAKFKNQTSKYIGVFWSKDCRKWKAQLKHKRQNYYGGYFDNEEQAAMKVNLLCDKYETDRKNPTITVAPDEIKQVQNPTSKYFGVNWDNTKKKWRPHLIHNSKRYYGGYFDNEKHAAMRVNLLCDKCEIQRKNPTIDIDLDSIKQLKQKRENQTSNYKGVCWNRAAKKWQTQLNHNEKKYHGGYYDKEENAAMKVNLLCDKYGIKRQNPTIIIEPHIIEQASNKLKNQASTYKGVYWKKDHKKWQAQLNHKKHQYYFGGYYDNEEHAAMKVNLLCDKYGKERQNPTIIIEPDAIQQVQNQTSNYIGVSWHKDKKKWHANLSHNKKNYHGNYFDNEEDAAMNVNSLCDRFGIQRKNPEINIDVIQKEFKSKTSIYTGVFLHKRRKKWQARLMHRRQKFHAGYFDNEEDAAMGVNLLCDKYDIERKNPTVNMKLEQIVQDQSKEKNIVKIEDESIIYGFEFKDECESNFMENKDKKVKSLATSSCKSQKRKRKNDSIMNDDEVNKQKVKITTHNSDENELLEKIQTHQYTKICN